MLLFELGFLPMDARPPRHAIVAELKRYKGWT